MVLARDPVTGAEINTALITSIDALGLGGPVRIKGTEADRVRVQNALLYATPVSALEMADMWKADTDGASIKAFGASSLLGSQAPGSSANLLPTNELTAPDRTCRIPGEDLIAASVYSPEGNALQQANTMIQANMDAAAQGLEGPYDGASFAPLAMTVMSAAASALPTCTQGDRLFRGGNANYAYLQNINAKINGDTAIVPTRTLFWENSNTGGATLGGTPNMVAPTKVTVSSLPKPVAPSAAP